MLGSSPGLQSVEVSPHPSPSHYHHSSEQPGSVLAACPGPYQLFQGLCLYFSPLKTNWYDGREFCRSQAGRLAEIDDADKNAAIAKAMASASITLLWFGLTDEEKEGSWVSASTGQAATFTNWRAGEPNGGGYQSCAAIVGTTSWAYTWDDVECNNNGFNFLCEKA